MESNKPQSYREYKFESHGITGTAKTLCGTGDEYERRMEGTLDVPYIQFKFYGSRSGRHPWTIETSFKDAVKKYIKYRDTIIKRGLGLKYRTNDMLAAFKCSKNPIYKLPYDNFIMARNEYNTVKAECKREIKLIKAEMVIASRKLNDYISPYKSHDKISEGIVKVLIYDCNLNKPVTKEHYDTFNKMLMDYYRITDNICGLSIEINKYKNKLIHNEYEYQLARIKLYEETNADSWSI